MTQALVMAYELGWVLVRGRFDPFLTAIFLDIFNDLADWVLTFPEPECPPADPEWLSDFYAVRFWRSDPQTIPFSIPPGFEISPKEGS